MKHLGWHPCRDDRDLWIKAETRPDDGVSYWDYILIYVDDILCVHHDNISLRGLRKSMHRRACVLGRA
jgi:acyl-CoA thioesterase